MPPWSGVNVFATVPADPAMVGAYLANIAETHAPTTIGRQICNAFYKFQELLAQRCSLGRKWTWRVFIKGVGHDALAASVRTSTEPWVDSDYYRQAEQWTDIFWNHDGPFRWQYDQLDKRSVIELAAGYGRHAERAAPHCGKLFVMDVIEYNVKICRLRLQRMPNVVYVVNNGYDYRPVPDGFVTGIYCYDSMVHFSPDLVAAYLADTFRVLQRGGQALFHHSNYLAPDARHYGQNPHARNSMTIEAFAQLSETAGLTVVHAEEVAWAGVALLDGVTLVKKK